MCYESCLTLVRCMQLYLSSWVSEGWDRFRVIEIIVRSIGFSQTFFFRATSTAKIVPKWQFIPPRESYAFKLHAKNANRQ